MSDQEVKKPLGDQAELSDEELDPPRKKPLESASSEESTASESEDDSRDAQRNGIPDDSQTGEKPVDLDEEKTEAVKEDQAADGEEQYSGSSESETESETETDSGSYSESESSDSER